MPLNKSNIDIVQITKNKCNSIEIKNAYYLIIHNNSSVNIIVRSAVVGGNFTLIPGQEITIKADILAPFDISFEFDFPIDATNEDFITIISTKI